MEKEYFLTTVLSKESCSTWGGGHFSTFDKYQYDFTGTCNYIFATVCDETSPDFNIQFRRGLDKKIARIIIELGPSVVIVEKGSISVRSVGVIKLPYTSNGIQIAPYGRSIRLVAKLMEMELVVMWNNDDYLMVLTEKKYMGKTCGMCGNYDGYELNEFVSEGKLLDTYKFAALQKMDDPSEICLSEEISISTFPHKKYDKIVISQNELLTDDDELKRLPYRSGDITIFRQSSIYIQMYTTFGLELVVQTSPVFQAYVKVGSQFKGRTLEISAETHCSIITKKGTVFEKCHAVVNPIPFYKIPTKCESGCVCADGLYENLDGRCVPAEECPCEYGGLAYGKGEQIQTECEMCTCTKGKWKCVQKSKCSSTCNLYGEGHITTFDGQRFVFDGNCEYILAMDGCSVNRPVSSFKIVTENVICGKSGVTCSRSISIYLGNLTFILRDETFTISGENPGVRYNVKKNALHLMFDIIIPGKYNMTLIWNKHMNFFIKISRETQETICGLCGNYNGNMKDDFETRSKYVASNEFEFVNSWKENPLCGDVYFVVDPCSKNPYRKAWAEKTCSIINSQVFSACHNKVNRMPYYEACVRDSCGCDIGGDCECMCDAIAVYAIACLDKGICIDWRTPEFCPVYCEYYNSHKKTGSDDAYSYGYNNDNCTWHYRPCNCPNQNFKYVNIEGCYNCSHDEYFDHEKERCMPCVGLSALSAHLQTKPSSAFDMPEGCHSEGPGQAQEVGPCEPHKVQQGQVQGPAAELGCDPQKTNEVTPCGASHHTEDHHHHLHQEHLCLKRGQPCQQPRNPTEKHVSKPQLFTYHLRLICFFPLLNFVLDTVETITSCSPNHQPQAYTYDPKAQAPFHNNECSKRVTCTRVLCTLHSQNQPAVIACFFSLLDCVLNMAEFFTPCSPNHQPPAYTYDPKAQAPFHNNECSKRVTCTRVLCTLHSQNQPAVIACFFSLLDCVLNMAEFFTPCSPNHQPQAYTYDPKAQAPFHNNECSKRVTCTRVLCTLHSQNQPAVIACFFSLLDCVLNMAEVLTPCSPNHQPPAYTYDPKAQAPFHNNECSKRVTCTRVLCTLHSQNQPAVIACFFSLLDCVLNMAEFFTPCSPNHQPPAYTYDPKAQALFPEDHSSKSVACTRVLCTLHSQNQRAAIACCFPLLDCVLNMAEFFTPCSPNHQPPAYTYDPKAQAPFHNNECSKRVTCTRVLCTLHSQNQPAVIACFFSLLDCVLNMAEFFTPCSPNHQPPAYTYDPKAQALFPEDHSSKSVACTRVLCTLHSQNQRAAIACCFPLLDCVLNMAEFFTPCSPNHQPPAYTYDPKAQAPFHNNECSKRVTCTRVLCTLHSQNQPAVIACFFSLLDCVLNMAEFFTPCSPNHQPQAYTYDPKAQAPFHNNECSKRVTCTRVLCTLHSQNQPAVIACFFSLLDCVLNMAEFFTPCSPNHQPQAYTYDPKAQAPFHNNECSKRVTCTRVLCTLHSQNQPAVIACFFSLLDCVLNMAEFFTPCSPNHQPPAYTYDPKAQALFPEDHSSKSVACTRVLCTLHSQNQRAAIACCFPLLDCVLNMAEFFTPCSPNHQPQAYTYDPKAQAPFHNNECSKRVTCTRVLCTLHSQNQPAVIACFFSLLDCVLNMAEFFTPW
ncbi:mucin-6 [Grus japonensis]|uniref:Mucin-6 n=1 Tax=Grus japonensis TaxID=30415 RepID=A0ABC9WXA6_GRUJA